LPETPPPELELTDDQWALVKEHLASKDLPKRDCDLAKLKAAGYCCWLECMMYRLATTILAD
jgi:hypothetical protein